jgi:hypothetical protein
MAPCDVSEPNALSSLCAVLQGLVPMLSDLVKRHIQYGVRVSGCWSHGCPNPLHRHVKISPMHGGVSHGFEGSLVPTSDGALQRVGRGTHGDTGGALQQGHSLQLPSRDYVVCPKHPHRYLVC